jgi:malonate-semialdehyde dehydrogenase (acetylating)/methylmalonate-semialdehyde dehydrogenase
MGAPEAFTATTEVGHYIAGRVGRAPRAPPAGLQPGDRRVARQVALARPTRSRAAVAAAQAAFPAWADTPPIRRAAC